MARSKKILIIGGAGFIGFHTAKRLSENNVNQITIIDNFNRGKFDNEFEDLISKSNVSYFQGDVTDLATFTNAGYDFNYIYNFAAVIGVANVDKHPDKVLYVNSLSMLNLFEYSKKLNNLEKILFASTSEIYSGTLKHYGIDVPTGESVNLVVEDIKSRRTTYALSKMFGESVAHNYGQKYDIPYTIVRYHNVYGPRMGFAHVIPETFIKIKNNDKIKVPSATHTRAFCYVDDAVEMTIKITEEKAATGETFHIGNSNEEIRIKDLVKKVAYIMSKSIEIDDGDDTPGSPARRAPKTEKISRFTGYKPLVDLETGITRTFSWYADKLDDRWE
jgi:UDP-glucose 4-epimerase